MYLNAHTYYSVRYGTLSVDELVSLSKSRGHHSIAITDINNSSGVLEFVKKCVEHGIKPIVGMEFREGGELLYVGIARNNEGFRELNELITQKNLFNIAIPNRPDLSHCYVVYPFGSIESKHLKENEFIGIRPKELNKILFEKSNQKEKMIAFPALTFQDRMGFELHKQLRSIDNNILISQLRPEQHSAIDETLMDINEYRTIYANAPELLRNNERIIDSCFFEFDFKKIKNKQIFGASKYDDKVLLQKLAYDGMEYRYGLNNKEAKRRIQSELEIIDTLGFSSYFLITWDVIRYSMSRGFYHVGRGSGANSVVAYCLKITDVCPIELDLYFERFLNPKRKSPPDFDIDYSWKERDSVTDYIFKRYGRQHTALLGAMSTFKDKSVLRELSKVYGLPKEETDRLIDYPDDPLNKNAIGDKIYSFQRFMSDFPNIRSIHAGGVLISEEPITNYVALDLPPKGFPTTQFDMYLAEDIHFDKLDILSQRGIGHIKDAVDIVRQNRKISIDIHQIAKFKKDEKVAEQLRKGDTIGCFYVESPAMRGLLKKLHCDNYTSLVAASSIIRPGVASSGMMREYILRFHKPDGFKYLHPIMEQQLKETYGVMIYQEDVLKICHHFGGLDLADADVLRRMMSGKGKGKKELQVIVDKFFANCKARGYPDELTNEVWRQIESFAGYSFSKAHSASYAVESYQSLYLKTYYPLEFIVGVINNFGGFYSTRVYVNEARKSGATINLPCVNRSVHVTTIYDTDIFLGFIHLQNLENHFARLIAVERERNGEYKDLDDFIHRTLITLQQLIILIRIGALRFTGKGKKELLWQAHFLLNRRPVVVDKSVLFETERMDFTFPKFETSTLEDVYDEIELLGFPVTIADFELLRTDFRGEINATKLMDHLGKKVKMVGSYVTTKYVRTKRKEIMNFGTWFDAEGNFFDTTHFPQSLAKYPFKGGGVYLILGKVVEEFGFPSLEVEKMAKLSIKLDPRIE